MDKLDKLNKVLNKIKIYIKELDKKKLVRNIFKGSGVLSLVGFVSLIVYSWVVTIHIPTQTPHDEAVKLTRALSLLLGLILFFIGVCLGIRWAWSDDDEKD